MRFQKFTEAVSANAGISWVVDCRTWDAAEKRRRRLVGRGRPSTAAPDRVDNCVYTMMQSLYMTRSHDRPLRRPMTPGISVLHRDESGIALASSWTKLSQVRQGRPGGLVQLVEGFLPHVFHHQEQGLVCWDFRVQTCNMTKKRQATVA